MSIFAATVALALSASSTPSEVREDLDAHPWQPTPATVAPSEAATPAVAKPAGESARSSQKDVVPSPNPPQPPATAAGTGYWQLQLGALQSPEAATSEKARLEKILGPGTVEILVDGSIRRLRYGKFGSKLEAESARTALKTKGVEGFPAQHP